MLQTLTGKYLNTVKIYLKGNSYHKPVQLIHLSCKIETGASMPKNFGRDYTATVYSATFLKGVW